MIKFPEPKPISFRNEIPEIENTGYLTHSVFFHPAKFIPQIVRYCLENYVPKDGKILDPFAGSGTTALEASLLGMDSFLIDINPLISFFYQIKFAQFDKNEWQTAKRQSFEKLDFIFSHENNDCSRWKDLDYWYPPQMFCFFSKVWNNFHLLPNNLAKIILAVALFKTAKKYSFAEHNMPKLFTSKRKREWLEETLSNNFFVEEIIREETRSEIQKIDEQVSYLLENVSNRGKVEYFAATDSYSFDYERLPQLDAIITSPPYLQAQEYIRTFKMELLWLGYDAKQVRLWQNFEIPFRPNGNKIKTNYLESIRQQISDKKLLALFDSYFWHTLKTLENAAKQLKLGGKLCVFIGNPKMQGIEVEIWKAIYEYFVKNLNYQEIVVFDDRIVTRKLFGNRNNPNPEGMKSEFMVVLEKVK
jgi:DNA modification methylase